MVAGVSHDGTQTSPRLFTLSGGGWAVVFTLFIRRHDGIRRMHTVRMSIMLYNRYLLWWAKSLCDVYIDFGAATERDRGRRDDNGDVRVFFIIVFFFTLETRLKTLSSALDGPRSSESFFTPFFFPLESLIFDASIDATESDPFPSADRKH